MQNRSFRLLRTLALVAVMGLLLPVGVRAADEKPAANTTAQKNPREILADWGVQFNATYIAETFGNISGGMRRGRDLYRGASISAPTSISKRSSAGPVRSFTPTCIKYMGRGCRAIMSAI